MVTLGSIPRETAALWFDFLTPDFRGRRSAIRDLTHGFPEFVFWVYPHGRLFDAKSAHRKNPPPGHEHILRDEPDYGGFLRGRVVRRGDHQLVVVYCRKEALAGPSASLTQFLRGMEQLPVPLDDDALVISDNGDIYGTITDLQQREDSGAVSDGANPV